MNTQSTVRFMPARDVKRILGSDDEFAVLDVREQEEFSRGHMLLASPAPLSRFEMLVFGLVPRKGTPIIVTDGGEEERSRAVRAAEILMELGYTDVAVMQGGMKSWKDAGFAVFGGVGPLSKGFGEYVEEELRTPRLEPQEVKKLLDAAKPCVVIDVRPRHEYERMAIPGAINAPGCEVTYRFADIVPDPETTVIINCAGRTRSIIGTQTLINAGVPNAVYALKGGTANWRLAGFELEIGANRHSAPPSLSAIAAATERTVSVAKKYGVKFVSGDTLARWQTEADTITLYMFDVRQPDEFATSHLPGSRNAQGGQLVQALDEYAAVRNARYVIIDDTGPRAIMTAHWLQQAGLPHVYVLRNGLGGSGMLCAGLATGSGDAMPPRPEAVAITPTGLNELLASARPPLVCNVGASKNHREAHIPGAAWVTRGYLDRAAAAHPDADTVIITAENEDHARFAAKDAARFWERAAVRVLSGGTAAWVAAGLPVEKDMPVAFCPEDDVWYKPANELHAPKEDVLGYFAWELNLVESIKQDGDVTFSLIK